MSQTQIVYSQSLGKFIAVEPGQSIDQAIEAATHKAMVPNLGGPLMDPSGSADETPQIDPRSFLANMGKTGLKAAEIGVGLMPGAGLLPTSLRMGTEAALGGLDGAMDGNALGGAVEQGALQGFGEGMGQLVPLAGNYLGMAIGNGFQRLKGGFNDAVGAFTRQGQRQSGRFIPDLFHGRNPSRIPVGSNRVKPAMKDMGSRIQAAEEANPLKTPVKDLAGANKEYFGDAVNSEFPHTVRTGILDDEKKFLEEQVIERNRDRLINFAKSRGWRTDNPAEVYYQLPKPVQQAMARDTQLTVRDLGELKRDISHQPTVGSLRSAQQNGQMVPAGAMERAQMGQNRAVEVNKARMGANHFRPAGAPDLAPLDEEFGDLAKMNAANDALRAGGKTFGDLSMYGIRGATGFMLGRALGLDPELAGLSGVAGMIGLSPINISRTANVAGRVGATIPTVKRAMDIKDDIQRTTRRKPKSKD